MYPELKQPAMRHAAYSLAQDEGFLVGNGFLTYGTDSCHRGIRVEDPVLFQAFVRLLDYILLSHSYITSPPKMNPPTAAKAMKPRRPAMVIATSP